ncbi:hypothetical protein CERSUDRAFT_24131, partial [Gelatoporia subvermispora B]
PNAQRGLKGHVIIHPQRPEPLLDVLPPSMTDILTSICVVFVGSVMPSREWVLSKAKPLAVRREKVHAALLWLKQNNPLYRGVRIAEEHLQALPEDGVLPYHVERVDPSAAQSSLTARYDVNETLEAPPDAMRQGLSDEMLSSVVITDVDGRSPANELRAAAIRHVKQKRGGFVLMPHEPTPVNEFFDPTLLPSVYPTLFPYGAGGLEDRARVSALSFKRHCKHL